MRTLQDFSSIADYDCDTGTGSWTTTYHGFSISTLRYMKDFPCILDKTEPSASKVFCTQLMYRRSLLKCDRITQGGRMKSANTLFILSSLLPRAFPLVSEGGVNARHAECC
jgi:hypothetical protein